MTHIIWDKPVRLPEALICGPKEAWDFMMTHWPHKKDLCFALASEAILAALDGRLSPDEARERFEAAIRSA